MQFRSGDYAVHPTYGLGNVVRLEERQLAEGELRQYYILTIGKNTVWVPVHADGSTTLRSMTPKQELDQYRALLKSQPAPLDRDRYKRRVEINERLTLGSFKVVCETVRDLSALGWYRRINEQDAALLLRVLNNLRREWAAAAGLSLPEATQEVDALLLAGREVHKA